MSVSEEQLVVTVGGECFSASFEGLATITAEKPIHRLFTLEDKRSNRGSLCVSVRMPFFGQFSDSRLGGLDFSETTFLWLNAVRRGFDQRLVSFDSEPTEEECCSIDLAEVGRPRSTDDRTVETYVIHKAYWLGYRNSRNPDKVWLDFAEGLDINYLGTTIENIVRIVWLLRQRGWIELKGGFETVGRPTSNLVDHYSAYLREQADPPKRTIGFHAF